MKFVKKNNIWYKHNNNSDKLYNFFHGWTDYNPETDIEKEFENWHDLYIKTGWHPFITDSKERNVWISPWGEYFSCNAHYLGAEKIIEVIYGIKEVDYADDYLVERRWVKGTTSLMWDMFYADMEYCITEKTKNAILKYCYTHNLRLPVDFKIVDDTVYYTEEISKMFTLANKLRNEIAERDGKNFDITMFKQTWPSSALGYEGMAGCDVITTADTIVIHTVNGPAYVYYASDKLAYKVENPNAKFYEDIKCHTLENKNIYEKH